MKKYIISIVVLLATLLCSCDKTGESTGGKYDANNTNELYLSKIIEVDIGQYNAEKEFNHKNIISIVPENYFDSDILLQRKLEINGIEYNLTYQDSLHYSIGNRKVHRYNVDGNDENVIMLDNDGKVESVLYKYTVLNISKTAFPNEVLELLETELSKIIDLSKYDNVKMPERGESTFGFGIYDYLFYSTVDNYITDYLKVSVSDDGGVFGVSVHDFSLDDYAPNIDKDKEKEIIELKLKDIYNTDTSNYQSYTVNFYPCITIYENQPYVQYFVSAKYVTTQGTEMESFINIVLIPVDLISSEAA